MQTTLTIELQASLNAVQADGKEQDRELGQN
jgi:hypothetical protein